MEFIEKKKMKSKWTEYFDRSAMQKKENVKKVFFI